MRGESHAEMSWGHERTVLMEQHIRSDTAKKKMERGGE